MVADGNYKVGGSEEPLHGIETLDIDDPTAWILEPMTALTHVVGRRLVNLGPLGEIVMAAHSFTYFLHPTELTWRTVEGGVGDNEVLEVAQAHLFPQCFEL